MGPSIAAAVPDLLAAMTFLDRLSVGRAARTSQLSRVNRAKRFMKKLPLVLLEFLWLFRKNEEDCKLAKAERSLGGHRLCCD